MNVRQFRIPLREVFFRGPRRQSCGSVDVFRARDFYSEKPVSDEFFRVYKSLYSYDKTPLQAIVESIDDAEESTREKISFAAAYGNERVRAYLFLPKKSQASFPDGCLLPGSEAIDIRSSATDPRNGNVRFCD